MQSKSEVAPKKGGLRERKAQYEEECRRKKDVKKYEELEVGQLDDSLTDVSRYATPLKTPRGKVSLEEVKKLDGSKRNVFDLEMSNNSSAGNLDLEDVSESQSGGFRPAVNSLRPGMMRGRSFDLDDNSPQKPQRVKDEDEKEAKEQLGKLLDDSQSAIPEDPSDVNKEPTRILPFTSVRSRYLKAVNNLAPKGVQKTLNEYKGEKEEYEKVKKQFIREETDKKELYGNLKSAWDKYEVVAQDKPAAPTEEEKESRDELEKVEDEVDKKWVTFAKDVVQVYEEDGDADDDDLDFWIKEAKRLSAEADARRRRKKKERSSEETKFWKEEAQKLRESVRNGTVTAHDDQDDDAGEEVKDPADSASDPDSPTSRSNSKTMEVDMTENGDASESRRKDDSSDSDSESSSSSDESKGRRKKKSKDKKKKKKKGKPKDKKDPTTPKASKKSVADKGPTSPASPRKDFILKDEDALPSTPRNMDGSLWKNPLNRWTNKPKKKVKEEGTRIIMRIPAKTDCWRKTRHNFIMDNAPFNWHKVSGDFEVIVRITGGFSKMYDKAGLMVRLDEENWILTGMEYFNDKVNHSTSVTRDFTDWSLSPLPENAEKAGVWFCFKRLGNSFETFYSYDSKKWVQSRQGLFTDRPVLQVGICGACPMGDEFKVEFDFYRVRSL